MQEIRGTTYSWTPGGSTSQTLNVSSSGQYIVQVTNAANCVKNDTINVTVNPNADATISSVLPVCSNTSSFNLNAAQSGGIWSGNGITNATSGLFSPSIAGAGNAIISYAISGLCGDMDTLYISVLPFPMLTADTINPGCPDFNNGSIIIQANGGTPPYSYLWSNGATIDSIVNLDNGIYSVTVTDANNCKEVKTVQFDALVIDCVSPVIYVPNIFSPNGDGQNDNLYIRGQGIISFDFVIFDRWGEKIFETEEQMQYWDGTFQGKEMPVGVYAYHLKVTLNDSREINKKGNISLVR
jgi:gliding motility-associated-like protein